MIQDGLSIGFNYDQVSSLATTVDLLVCYNKRSLGRHECYPVKDLIEQGYSAYRFSFMVASFDTMIINR